MKRKMKEVPYTKHRAMVYSCALVGLAVYALPRLPALRPGLGGTFTVLWILVTALVLSANLYFLVGADKERSRMLEEMEILPAPDEPARQGLRRSLG
ncbi:hypothetical protein [Alicyclobacillus macrosporangiidus]|uniref:Uncharacterized protein n=1 Tax=Alicyclobacillus macrosporangiidus TaxID=392015 RepID=A0A1I7GDW0_9BACL|nr:hypothetical protein [Alicyclobacillus macrosporangiidus]SFU46618.1 hypothetical protein SAMN05421543_102155 [Alicyclobacillus macrosporangiidus]